MKTENIRKAHVNDVRQIHPLINFYANQNLMIARSLNELYENLRDFWVLEDEGKILACCALHIVGWQDLAEIKSLAVDESIAKQGIGSHLVKKCLKEAVSLGIRDVFALTYAPEFFKKLGFKEVDKAQLPHKIWAECCNCPKFPDCGESALRITVNSIS